MNVLELFQTFQTQEQAVEHLEQVRWRGRPVCPYCQSEKVSRHASGDRPGHRWQCRDCTRAFAVTVGTLLHGTHMPLRQWFFVLALMLNGKKLASAYQISRDTGIRRATVWSMMQRIRTAMVADTDESRLLYGIVKADETYAGSKPRKVNNRDEDGNKPAKRGHGTTKVSVIGIIENGNASEHTRATPDDAPDRGITNFMKRFVDPAGAVLILEECGGCRRAGGKLPLSVITHAKHYAEGETPINTLEGFWSFVKHALYGSHQRSNCKYISLGAAHACFDYNRREPKCTVDESIAMFVGV